MMSGKRRRVVRRKEESLERKRLIVGEQGEL